MLWVIVWHIVLPTITIGAVSFFVIAEGLALVTGASRMPASRRDQNPFDRARHGCRHGNGDVIQFGTKLEPDL